MEAAAAEEEEAITAAPVVASATHSCCSLPLHLAARRSFLPSRVKAIASGSLPKAALSHKTASQWAGGSR
jgi:hypothetical protein